MLLTYVIGCFALIIKPGPDLMCTIATAIADGRKCAVTLMAGLILGCWLWILLLAAGFAPFFASHQSIMKAVQGVGVCYIAFLAFCAFREAAAGFHHGASTFALKSANGNGWRLVGRGVAMSMSNPLTILFFLAFLPHFTTADSSLPPSVQTLILGALFCLLVPFIYMPLILLADSLRTHLFNSHKALASLKLVSAIILVAVAAILAASLL